jgi:hypothetical protein
MKVRVHRIYEIEVEAEVDLLNMAQDYDLESMQEEVAHGTPALHAAADILTYAFDGGDYTKYVDIAEVKHEVIA